MLNRSLGPDRIGFNPSTSPYKIGWRFVAELWKLLKIYGWDAVSPQQYQAMLRTHFSVHDWAFIYKPISENTAGEGRADACKSILSIYTFYCYSSESRGLSNMARSL
jgi:hypothetical protein